MAQIRTPASVLPSPSTPPKRCSRTSPSTATFGGRRLGSFRSPSALNWRGKWASLPTPGVFILKTVPGGAADKAGLRGGKERAYLGNTEIYLGGDLIVGLDDQPVTNPQDLAEIMNRHEVGDSVVVTFLRGQKTLTAKVILGDAASYQN